MAKAIRLHIAGAATLAGVALAVAGCGSSSNPTSSAAAATTSSAAPAAATSSAAPSGSVGVAVSTASGSAGTYLTASGRALYLWVADGMDKSSCSGECAKAWPPLTTTAAPKASGAVKASALGTITRPDGTKQVTYMGHALYYFVADKSSGQTSGQGSNSFGAKWWLVAPSGQAITKGGSSSAGTSSSSSKSGWG